MTIVLTYTKKDGSQEQVEYEDDVFRIFLDDREIASIDLTPLSTCTNLHKLELNGNEIQSLDLTPLISCTRLQVLNLYNNQLQSIDLTPLATCTNLWALYLESNQLQSLDLTPLATCTNLQRLYLSVNQLQSLDLTPLATFPSLQPLKLGGTPHQSSDTQYSWLRHEQAIYKRPISTYPWSFLYMIAEQFGTDCRVQQDIPYAMGLKNYGFIDCDLSDLFLSIPADTPIDMAREQARARLLEEVVQAIDQVRITTGLTIVEMSAHHAEIAKRIQRIIDLRKAEMQRVIVEVRGTKVDLRELWLTAYGCEVLTALDMQLTTDLEGLEKIKKDFSEMGFDLRTSRTSISGVKMSNELKQAIWWIVENRDRRWREILEQERGEKS